MTCFNRIILELKRVWQDSPPLTAVTVLMIGVFAASVAGIALDPRTITGVPAWLKPAKFAISTAIFCGTMAWLFRYINIWEVRARNGLDTCRSIGTGSRHH